MSRYCDEEMTDENAEFRWGAWMSNYHRALRGKKGRRALRELREALLALPEHKLISNALCTVNPEHRKAVIDDEISRDSYDWMIEHEGEGVCLIGAYLWHRKVKEGMDPAEAFDALPNVGLDENMPGAEALDETAWLAARHGMTYTLAYTLAHRNDVSYDRLSPEERYARFLGWIDTELAKEV